MKPAIQGFGLGMSLIWVPGPQNVFLVADALAHKGVSEALVVASTASVCDTILICAAVASLTIVTAVLDKLRRPLMLLGAVYLAYLAIAFFYAAPPIGRTDVHDWTLLGHITRTISVSLINPHAIAEVFGILGTFALAYQPEDRTGFALGCIASSWAWFFALVISFHTFGRFDEQGHWTAWVLRLAAGFLLISCFRLFRSIGHQPIGAPTTASTGG
jgi:L-lysine exporter family protein LysE/ArgO